MKRSAREEVEKDSVGGTGVVPVSSFILVLPVATGSCNGQDCLSGSLLGLVENSQRESALLLSEYEVGKEFQGAQELSSSHFSLSIQKIIQYNGRGIIDTC